MKIYCVTRTLETDGIREFDILIGRKEKEIAICDMQNLINNDDTRNFGRFGINIECKTETYCESIYNENGFVRLEIIEIELE